MQLRKVLKNRGHFPSDEAATKLIYLALRDITKKWKNRPITWKLAATQFAIHIFGTESAVACVADQLPGARGALLLHAERFGIYRRSQDQ